MRHITVVTTRRQWQNWFRLTYWVRCWICKVEEGPFTDWQVAMDRANVMLGKFNPDNPDPDDCLDKLARSKTAPA